MGLLKKKISVYRTVNLYLTAANGRRYKSQRRVSSLDLSKGEEKRSVIRDIVKQRIGGKQIFFILFSHLFIYLFLSVCFMEGKSTSQYVNLIIGHR